MISPMGRSLLEALLDHEEEPSHLHAMVVAIILVAMVSSPVVATAGSTDLKG